MKTSRYPRNLFLLGCAMNFFKNCLLNVAMIVALLIGIWSRPALYVGLALLAINITLAFIMQIRIKRAIKKMQGSQNDDARQFSDIILDPNWVKNVKNYTENKMNNDSLLSDYTEYTDITENENNKNEENQK